MNARNQDVKTVAKKVATLLSKCSAEEWLQVMEILFRDVRIDKGQIPLMRAWKLIGVAAESQKALPEDAQKEIQTKQEEETEESKATNIKIYHEIKAKYGL